MIHRSPALLLLLIFADTAQAACGDPPRPDVIWIACNLAGADLKGADLRNAVLSRSSLQGANLSTAQLTHADLSFADLREADLSRAVMRDAHMVGCGPHGRSSREPICAVRGSTVPI